MATQADSALISGAYAAAGGGIKDYGLAASKGLNDVAKASGKMVSDVIYERQQRWQKFADWTLGQEGLTDEEYTRKEEELKKKKAKFILGGKNERAMLMREVEVEKTERDHINNLRKKIGETYNDNESGLQENYHFLGDPKWDQVIEQMQNGSPVKHKGEPGYWILDEDNKKLFMSIGEIERDFENNLIDWESKQIIQTSVEDIINVSGNLQPGEDNTFPYDAAANKVRTSIVDKGNLRSLTYDEIIPGRSFYTSLQHHIHKDEGWEQFGLTREQIDLLDPGEDNDPNIISKEDAKTIVDALIKDRGMLKDYLTTYYTNYAQNNWTPPPAATNESEERKDFNKAFAYHREKLIKGEIEHAALSIGPVGMDKHMFDHEGKKYHPFVEKELYEGLLPSEGTYVLSMLTEIDGNYLGGYEFKPISDGTWKYRYKTDRLPWLQAVERGDSVNTWSKAPESYVSILNKKFPNAISDSQWSE